MKPPTPVRPHWLVDGEAFTLTELLILASFAKLLPPPERER
ncbi:hypothetical protein [Methylobacterium sp. J-076]|nr:hypothetical protein [Methylobacterium sp. J-076]